MARREYTPEEQDEALKLYNTDGPTVVQVRLGIPKSTVTKWAKKRGVPTVHTLKTKAATEAKQADDKAVRAMIASDGLNVARIAADIIKRRMAVEADDIPLKDLATLYGIFIDKHSVLTKLDVGNQDHSAVDKWLDYITGGASGDETPGGEVSPGAG